MCSTIAAKLANVISVPLQVQVTPGGIGRRRHGERDARTRYELSLCGGRCASRATT